MKLLPALAIGLTMASCSPVHTAVSPVATPEGVPIAIQIPGTTVGTEPKASQVLAVRETLLDGVDEAAMKSKYMPGFDPKIDTVVMAAPGVVGSFKTKKGQRFIGLAPAIVVTTNRPAADAERAAASLAANAYRTAKRNYQVYSQNELQKKQ